MGIKRISRQKYIRRIVKFERVFNGEYIGIEEQKY